MAGARVVHRDVVVAVGPDAAVADHVREPVGEAAERVGALVAGVPEGDGPCGARAGPGVVVCGALVVAGVLSEADGGANGAWALPAVVPFVPHAAVRRMTVSVRPPIDNARVMLLLDCATAA